MITHAETNGMANEWLLSLEAATINSAIKMGLEAAPEEEMVAIFQHLGNKGIVGYMMKGNFGYARLLPGKEFGSTTIAMVGDGNPVLATHPYMREVPCYVDAVDAIFLPKESLASPQILAGILLHEGAHQRDLNDPAHTERAGKLFPNVAVSEAERLLTEVNAFELEGRLLDKLLGEEYAAYIESEIVDADERAIRDQVKNGGLLIEAGVNKEDAAAAVTKYISFTNPEAADYCAEILAMALPLHVGLRVIDRICDRNQVDADERLTMKATMVAGFGDYIY